MCYERCLNLCVDHHVSFIAKSAFQSGAFHSLSPKKASFNIHEKLKGAFCYINGLLGKVKISEL